MPYRIVVADKDARSREAVSRLLVAQDNEFVGVASAGELKKAIKDEKPDLIILNSVLADTPGWAAVQQVVKGIKGHKDFGDVPVILMTGDPGGPAPAEVTSSGADGYLAKPIDGAALRDTIRSLLSIAPSTTVQDEDEEILIDFADDDSGDMTEELLAMSNVAMEAEDTTSTGVGDTVEIDTGTLVAELDRAGEVGGEHAYEDTVRLNLEDMGLEDEQDSGTFEPTIELISDIPADYGAPSLEEVREEAEEIESQEPLPDFSSITKEMDYQATPPKDSVTLEMDVDDLGLEMDSYDTEQTAHTEEVGTLDLDDTEIGEILDVREPSKVVTSKDLALDDESLVRESDLSTTVSEVEVIDLEEDTEIREIEMEELEAVQAGEVAFPGLDEDETEPAESLAIEEAAEEEEFEEISLDETEQADMMLESPLDAAVGDQYEEEFSLEAGAAEEFPLEKAGEEGLSLDEAGEEELSLDEVGEEMTTQEFFGEELPTEEFPTEKYPDEKTRDLMAEEEITLDDIDLHEELSLEREVPVDEMTLEGEAAEAMLFDEAREEEPMLEVTEDISFDEISLEEEVPEEDRTEKIEPPEIESLAFEEPEVEPVSSAPAPPPPSMDAYAAAAAEVAAPPVIEEEVIEFAEPAKPAPAEPPHIAVPPITAPSAADIISTVSSLLEDRLTRAVPAKAEFAESVDTAVKRALPSKDDLSEEYRHALAAAVPSKEEIVAEMLRKTSVELPSRDAVFWRIDQALSTALPSRDELMAEMLKRASDAVPTRDAMFWQIDQAVSRSLPSQEEIAARVDRAIQAALPPTEMILQRLDETLGALPSPEDIHKRVDAAVSAIPSAEAMMNRVESALGAIPSQREIRDRVDESIRASLPPAETILERLDEALKAIPSPEEINRRVDAAVGSVPSAETIMDRVERSLSVMPARDEISDRLDQAIRASVPSAEAINARLDELLRSIGSRDVIKDLLDAALSKAVSPELVAERLDVALRAMPSQEYVRLRLDNAFAALPSADSVNARIDMALQAIPSQAEVNSRLEKAFAAIPSPESVAEGLDRALAVLPSGDVVMKRIDETLGSLPSPDQVWARVDGYLASLMPTKEAVWLAFQEMLGRRLERLLSDEDIRNAFVARLPQTEEIVASLRTALPEKERFQEALSNSLATAIQGALPERVWLESVSRGLFDERTRGLLPKREEVVSLLREEIRLKFLDTVERIIREQIERLTSDLKG